MHYSFLIFTVFLSALADVLFCGPVKVATPDVQPFSCPMPADHAVLNNPTTHQTKSRSPIFSAFSKRKPVAPPIQELPEAAIPHDHEAGKSTFHSLLDRLKHWEKSAKKEGQQAGLSGRALTAKNFAAPKRTQLDDKKAEDVVADDSVDEDGELKAPKYSVPDFRVVKSLGQGSGGHIYEVEHIKTFKRYALKKMRFKGVGYHSDEDYLNKVTSEYNIHHCLSHPNVVRSIQLMRGTWPKTIGSRLFELMELCPNGDLFKAVMKGPASKMQVSLCIMKQLLVGLDYIHSHGVAHLDIKPENILIGANKTFKFTDFGISKFDCHNCTRGCKGVSGSAPYIAPELHFHESYDGTKADIWSLGITYFAMRSQSLPWRTTAFDKLSYNPLIGGFDERGLPMPLPTFEDPRFNLVAHDGKMWGPNCRIQSSIADPDERDFIKKMLDLDPNKRATARELLEDPWFVRNTQDCTRVLDEEIEA